MWNPITSSPSIKLLSPFNLSLVYLYRYPIDFSPPILIKSISQYISITVVGDIYMAYLPVYSNHA